MKKNLLGMLVVLSTMSRIVCAGDEKDADKKIIVPAETESSRWSVSTGVTLSSIQTKFRGDPSLVSVIATGVGSTSLYNGGPTPVVYGNGTVGLPGTLDAPSGTTGFTGGNETLVAIGQFGFSRSQVSFNSVSGATSPLADDSDRELSVGPYVKLAYVIKQWDEKNSLSLFVQYAFTTAFNSGAPSSGSGLTAHTFTYDVFHGDFSPTVDGAAIFNAANFNTNVGGNIAGLGPALAPRHTTSPFLLGIYEPESINIYLHTFTLGIDYTHDVGNLVHLVLSTGPTLNLFDYDYHTPGIAVVNGIPVAYAAPQSNSSQKLRFGWVGRAGVTIDLDSRKIYFAELSGEYHWVQDFDVNTNLGSATVNASSWGVSLGLGRRF